MSYLYDPVEKTVTYKDQIVQFYCGPELGDTAIILLDFYFQRTNLQETFIRLMTVNEIAKNTLGRTIDNDDSELAKEIEKQISNIKNGGHFGKVTFQDATKLADLMGNDMTFETNHSEMINYYIMLLSIKKFIKEK